MTRKILIIEDEPQILAMMKLFLEKSHSCSTATCLKEAFDLLNKEKFELVISDLNLPDSYQYNLMDYKKSSKSEFKVMYSTGDSCDKLKQELLSSGADLVLHKPFAFKELTKLVDDIF